MGIKHKLGRIKYDEEPNEQLNSFIVIYDKLWFMFNLHRELFLIIDVSCVIFLGVLWLFNLFFPKRFPEICFILLFYLQTKHSCRTAG